MEREEWFLITALAQWNIEIRKHYKILTPRYAIKHLPKLENAEKFRLKAKYSRKLRNLADVSKLQFNCLKEIRLHAIREMESFCIIQIRILKELKKISED